MPIKTIGMGLLKSWKEQARHDVPLKSYLYENYVKSHLVLCFRLNIKHLGFGEWLGKSIDSLL